MGEKGDDECEEVEVLEDKEGEGEIDDKREEAEVLEVLEDEEGEKEDDDCEEMEVLVTNSS